MEHLQQIRQSAREFEWQEIMHNEMISLVSFRKKDCRMNVYYSKMTVGTSMSHPTKGKTQLFRKHVSMKLLRRLFQNPRIHTRKGYYEKYTSGWTT